MDIWLQVKLINRLVPDALFDIIDGNTILWLDDRDQPSDDALLAELQNYNDEVRADELTKKLDTLADSKTKEAKNYVTEKHLSDEQLFRYIQKEAMARAYKTDGSWEEELGWEADLAGLTVDELADLIIQLADEYNNNMNKFVAMIEAFRVRINIAIKDKLFTEVESVINDAYSLPVTATIDEVKALLDKYDLN